MNVDSKVVLGVNLSHDTSCAAVVGGEVRVAVAEERLNRVKHCTGNTVLGKIIPYRSIRYCCEALEIDPKEVSLFVVNSCLGNAAEQLRAQLIGIPGARVVDTGHPGHHLAHAYSTFFCSAFDDSAIIVTDTNGSFIDGPDGISKKEHFTCYRGSGRGLSPVIEDYVHPGEVSVGELYCIFSAVLQLTPKNGPYGNDDPLSAGGKLMGLAAYDRSRSKAPALWEWTEGEHLKIRLDRVIAHLRRKGVVEDQKLADLSQTFGYHLWKHVTFAGRTASLKQRRYTELAGEAQRLLEETLLEIARRTHARVPSKNLCLAGGNMLNVIACTRLLEETPFEHVFVQPASNDAGIAIGAALYGYREILGGRTRPYLTRDYDTCLGRSYTNREVEAALRAHGGKLAVQRLKTQEVRVRALVPLLAQDEVVGIFCGGSEFGPRALGHRSFLASPAKAGMRERLNRIKGREWYRPVAPLVLESKFGDYFSAPFARSPFMTLSANCKPVTVRHAPSVVHVDGTARPQTVSRSAQPELHRLLTAWEERSGVPILINTSLNVAGEPIAETPTDALRTFQAAAGVEYFLLGEFLLQKTSDKRARYAPR